MRALDTTFEHRRRLRNRLGGAALIGMGAMLGAMLDATAHGADPVAEWGGFDGGQPMMSAEMASLLAEGASTEDAALGAYETAAAARQHLQRHERELAELSDELSRLGPKIIDTEARLDAARAEMGGRRREIAAAQARYLSARRELAGLLGALQNVAREPMPSILAQPGRAIDAARGAILLRHVSARARAAHVLMQAHLAQLEVSRAAAQDLAQRAGDDLRKLRASETRVQELLALKRAVRRDAQGAVNASEIEARELADEVASLTDFARALTEREEAARLEAARQEQVRADAARREAIRREVAKAEAAAREAAKRQAEQERLEEERRAQKRLAEERARIELMAQRDSERREAARLAAKQMAAQFTDGRLAREVEDLQQVATLDRVFVPPIPEELSVFSDKKHPLIRPVSGDVMRVSGYRSVGVFYDSRANARVLAPWSGKILYADKFQSEGDIVIIEPQSGYQILLVGLEGLDVRKGDDVSAGEPIGRMAGATADIAIGDQGARRLYLEIHYNGAPVDPVAWMSNETLKVSGL